MDKATTRAIVEKVVVDLPEHPVKERLVEVRRGMMVASAYPHPLMKLFRQAFRNVMWRERRITQMVALTVTVPALHAAGLIGIWNTDVAVGRSVLDEGAAAVMAGDADLAGQPLPLEVALGRVHPDDRDWLFGQIRQARRTGGPFSAEFRVLGEAGDIRWVLNRGTISHTDNGALQGLGAYIDTTAGHRNLSAPAALFAPDIEDPLLVAANRCIEVHEALKRGDHADLSSLSESLLTSIGRTLARRMSS